MVIKPIIAKKIKKQLCSLFLIITNIGSIGAILSCGRFGSDSNFVGIGSNSVSPLVMGENSLMTKNPVGQYVYQNTGSGDGYKSQMSNPNRFESDFGMTSSRKNPVSYSGGDNARQIQLEQLWSKKQLRTVTYAFDAIGIGVNLPSGMELKDGAQVPIISLDNLAKLYSKDPSLVKTVTWSKLVTNEMEAPQWDKKLPIAIGIEGGEATSGKSEAFVKVINRILEHTAQNPNQEIVAKNQDFSFTDNFNDIYAKNKNVDGSIAYYSLGQISAVQSQDIILAGIDKLMDDPTKIPTIQMVQTQKYRWSRPFNIIYSVTNDKSVAFANYLLSDMAQLFIKKQNFVGLSQDQITIQLPTWLPDLDLKIDGINKKTLNGIIINYGL